MNKVNNKEKYMTPSELKIEEIRIKIYQRIYKMRAGDCRGSSARRLGMLDAVAIINEVTKNG